MHCFYTNCDSLLNKREELETRMLTSEALICAITEILPKPCVSKPTPHDFVVKDYFTVILTTIQLEEEYPFMFTKH